MEKYLKEIQESLKLHLENKKDEYERSGKSHNLMIDEKMKGYYEIHKILCINFEEYFLGIKPRKKAKKK